jgi:AcrR family transcriptional regulator
MSADERRDQILEVAVTEFALSGLYGTSTETIAQGAGVSQPYLFRLFGTKKELFIAAARLCFDRVREVFRIAVEADTDSANALHAMGEAYIRMMTSRENLLMQLQMYAACGDDDVRTEVGRQFADLFAYCAELSGAGEERIVQFMSVGMLINVALATGNEHLVGKEALMRCVDLDV